MEIHRPGSPTAPPARSSSGHLQHFCRTHWTTSLPPLYKQPISPPTTQPSHRRNNPAPGPERGSTHETRNRTRPPASVVCALTLLSACSSGSGTTASSSGKPLGVDYARSDAALAAGAGFVPQDRHHQGLRPRHVDRPQRHPVRAPPARQERPPQRDRRDRLADNMTEKLAIKTPGPDLPVSSLSGGNQQKVVMARALADDPRLLVLINPTAGVDVRSKEFLLRSKEFLLGKVEETARTGTGVLIASDELDDLLMCDRILVMFQGRVTTGIARGWHDHDLVAATEAVDLNA
ncbi:MULTISPECIES: ATP-binding cassette domain-containing protein [Streptomyces]|uniref:ATP-binding cassette domain-containing protein n=1 Tax=Streptomyces TaxID=1883 RepID=UPI00131A9935|nr:MULTISPECIES: ATP-binding cassette domain-containing protein [Streptomyces]